MSASSDQSPQVYVTMDSSTDNQTQQVYTDEDNRTYIAFIKAFAPVLLHLSDNDNEIKSIIVEFQEIPEDADPDKTKTDRLRGWVDSKMDVIGNMTQEEIDDIIKTEKLKKLEVDAFHKQEYALHSKRKLSDNCLITMDAIRRDEYYVDFLDNGKPYKVNAIIEYYKRLKLDEVPIDEWKTPLRNPITEEDRKLLEDLEKWYNNQRMCTRSKTQKLQSRKKSIAKSTIRKVDKLQRSKTLNRKYRSRTTMRGNNKSRK